MNSGGQFAAVSEKTTNGGTFSKTQFCWRRQRQYASWTASNSADRHRSGKRKSWTRKLDGGMAKRRKVPGNAWVDKGLANRNAFNTNSRS